MSGVDFDGFGGHFGLHFESNFGYEMRYFSSYYFIDCGYGFDSILIMLKSILECFGARAWSTVKHLRLWKIYVLPREFNDFQGSGSTF